MASKKRNIIITADDYGCCDYIDRGIIKGIGKGVISCVSTFVNFEAREKGERGGAYCGSVEAIKKLLQLFPRIPIGLHLTINAGTSIKPKDEVIDLLRPNKINKKHYFKSFQKFDPNLYFQKKVIKQIKSEIEGQIDFYKKEFNAKNLNHLSCHYGILFHFEKILNEVITIPDFKTVPIRNPVLSFQTPIIKKEPSKKELKAMHQFFRSKSKMRLEGLGNVIRWSDTVEKFVKIALQGGSVKRRLAVLQNNKTRFPEFTLDYLYQRQKDFKNMAVPIAELIKERPEYYLQPSTHSPIYELIAHVGSGRLPETGPVGVNKSYFLSRALELKRLIDSEQILKSSSLKLVDYRAVSK